MWNIKIFSIKSMPLGKLNLFKYISNKNKYVTLKKIKKENCKLQKTKNIFLVSKRSRTGYGSGTNMNSMTAGGGGSGSTSLLHNGENLVKKSGSNFHKSGLKAENLVKSMRYYM